MAIEDIIEQIREDYLAFYPKALILFGSTARYLAGMQEEAPQDIDIIFIGSMKPFHSPQYDIKHDLFFYFEDEILKIAKSLRNHPRTVSRAKMYMRDTWECVVRSDIAACLLLGACYQEYGFLQMENEEKFRDYSVHTIIHGGAWWKALQKYAQTHRGLKGLFFDKANHLDIFVP
jgi:hypothetical protein